MKKMRKRAVLLTLALALAVVLAGVAGSGRALAAQNKGWRADGRGRTFGRNSGGVVEDWIWRLCVE